ncbi:Hint domain-containing protein [Ruegeria halocynthiae]|uniref:Hint domain-containing protein n=1 Tax=Ruegeria halocynthiae TaxID=985054 RepID=A0A1H3B486_9RHOB|nr:Hint domain-containing protein [Ruegeria halocynthiae]SDX35869.1 Hint domain-containing protein [Ruegeria halocynthiae]
MPTTYTDQFYSFDPANPPPSGTSITIDRFDLVDQDDNGEIEDFGGDTVDGQTVASSWPGDTVTINVPGVGNVTYEGITFYLSDGVTRVFTPTDGQVLQEGTLVSTTFVNTQGPLDVPADLGPPCFTPGTLIDTPDGPRRVEDLTPGDLVTTADSGAKPVIWVGRTTVAAEGKLAPIRFEAGVFGLTQPLLVSPQHRMLIDDWRAPYLFGHEEVLIAAHCLVNGESVTRVEGGEVEYIHLLFRRHEIVIANGAKSESYYPGHALTQAEHRTQAEVLALFPELKVRGAAAVRTARPVVRPRDGQILAK